MRRELLDVCFIKMLRGLVPPPFSKSETDDFSSSRGESQRFGIVGKRERDGEEKAARGKGKNKIKGWGEKEGKGTLTDVQLRTPAL